MGLKMRVASLIALAAIIPTPVLPQDAAAALVTTMHAERNTPRLQILAPEQQGRQALMTTQVTPQDMPDKLIAAWRFLTERASEYGLTPDLSSLQHVGTQETELGSVFRFSQQLGGRRVADGEIVVSVNNDNQVYQVYNNIYPATAEKAARASFAEIPPDRARDLAWDTLGAQKLLAEPLSELVYIPDENGFVLAYDVRLYVTRNKTDGEAEPGY